jgi:hypothetical protein
MTRQWSVALLLLATAGQELKDENRKLKATVWA